MLITAKINYLRIAPRKVRMVADLIRGKKVEEVQNILSFTIKKAAPVFLKLLKQAVSDAKNNFQLEEKNLYIYKVLVDEGPKYKRWMPRSRGQASPINKRTSHIKIVLGEIEEKPKKTKKAEKKTDAVSDSALNRKKISGEDVKKTEKNEKVEEFKKTSKIEKQKLKPKIETAKPKIEKGLKRIFRRKSF